MSNIDRAAEVIGAWIDDNLPHDETNFGADEGITQALADAGLLAPDLPEPMQPWEAERTGGTPGSRWYGYADDGNDDGSEMYNPNRYIDAYPWEVWIDGHVLLVPEEAKAYALALLAAADYAKEVGTDGQDD